SVLVQRRRMSEGETCPKCGSGLSPGALEGLCARCLAELALGLEPTRAAEPAKSPQTAPPPPAAQAESSARVFGDYELLQEIARGGRGVLYKARQRSLNRIVAVKMIESGEFASEAFVRRSQAEAQAAANLPHPNIVAT